MTYRYFTSTLEEALAQALQAMWKETLNVDVAIEAQEYPVFMASLKPDVPIEEMPEMWRLGWGADYPDENNWVYEVLHCTDSTNYLAQPAPQPTKWPSRRGARSIRTSGSSCTGRSSR